MAAVLLVALGGTAWSIARMYSGPVTDLALRRAIHQQLDQRESSEAVRIEQLRELTSLTINDSRLRTLDGLQYATQLTSLTIDASSSDECGTVSYAARFDPAFIGTLSTLEELDLSNNDMPLHDLRWLHGCSRLRKLNLSGNGLASLDGLEGLQALEELRLESTFIHDWSALPQSRGLRELWVAQVRDPIPWQTVAACEHLERLSVSDDWREDDNAPDLATIATIPQLKSLRLSYLELDDIRPLEAAPLLYDLFVEQPQPINGLRSDDPFRTTIWQRYKAAEARHASTGERLYNWRTTEIYR